jgi:hypothetical protein
MYGGKGMDGLFQPILQCTVTTQLTANAPSFPTLPLKGEGSPLSPRERARVRERHQDATQTNSRRWLSSYYFRSVDMGVVYVFS